MDYGWQLKVRTERFVRKIASAPRIRFGVSTYSFWQFRDGDPPSIESCLARTADMGFDGAEILHVQMGDDQSNARLQRIKRQAFRAGLDLCGFFHPSILCLPRCRRSSKEYRAYDPLY